MKRSTSVDQKKKRRQRVSYFFRLRCISTRNDGFPIALNDSNNFSLYNSALKKAPTRPKEDFVNYRGLYLRTYRFGQASRNFYYHLVTKVNYGRKVFLSLPTIYNKIMASRIVYGYFTLFIRSTSCIRVYHSYREC